MKKERAITEFKQYCTSDNELNRQQRQQQIRNSFNKNYMDITGYFMYENITWKNFGIRVGKAIGLHSISIFDEKDNVHTYPISKKQYLELRNLFYKGTGYVPN